MRISYILNKHIFLNISKKTLAPIHFDNSCILTKYIVPEGYPNKSLKNYEFYVFPTSHSNDNIYDFCSAVLKENKTPVLITPLTGWNATYPSTIQVALKLSDKVRKYESAKMGMMSVLENRAKQFIKINGGVVWTR